MNIYMLSSVFIPSNILLLFVCFLILGEQGDFWKAGKIYLRSDKNFQIVIEGKRGTSYKGDISIDDISFSPDCQPDFKATLDPNPITASPPPGCKTGEFRYEVFLFTHPQG